MRIQGRIVFFCGSGVSIARAELPDFFGLAEKVISKLGVSKDSQAYKLFNKAKELEGSTVEPGLISADRIFGLLERDFMSSDINTAVAECLKTKKNVNLSAHKTILKLATTNDEVKLVTTNFDRLFELCDPKLNVFVSPKIPDVTKESSLNGIVYLHGRANKDYRGAGDDGFILSSSEFGRAYLADGWATKFYKDVIDKYVVVFIGYSADDPPVQYLLEALNKKTTLTKEVYASNGLNFSLSSTFPTS